MVGVLTAVVGIVTAASALLGVWITQRHESRKRESEERRWYADYFLGRKIDALSNLHAALFDCHSTMAFYGNVPPRTLQEFKERVQPKEEAYLRAMAMASIYLNEEANAIMSDTLGAFRQASTAIWLALPDDECPVRKESYDDSVRYLNWHKFRETYETAVGCLKGMLSPEVLASVGQSK